MYATLLDSRNHDLRRLEACIRRAPRSLLESNRPARGNQHGWLSQRRQMQNSIVFPSVYGERVRRSRVLLERTVVEFGGEGSEDAGLAGAGDAPLVGSNDFGHLMSEHLTRLCAVRKYINRGKKSI